MSSVIITKSSKKRTRDKQMKQICNLEREYRDCIKSRRDKIGITMHIMMHQVLYIVQLPNEEGDMQHLVHLVIPILSLLLFIQSLYSLSNFFHLLVYFSLY